MCCNLMILRNAMRASRCCTGTPSMSPTETGLSFAYEQWKQQELPKVLRLLGGRHHDEEIGDDRGAPTVSDWDLNQELVADLEELVLDTTAPVGGREVKERVATETQSPRLDAAATSLLAEISAHPQWVGLLMQRRTLLGLAASCRRPFTGGSAEVATQNLCAEYRRRHSLSKFSMPRLTWQD
ncbi:unnamed protein product, partial [Ectocarpus sp. 12 AP-2014]